MLAWAVATRDRVPPALTPADVVPIEIPIQREPGGRFYLCSFSSLEVESHERRWLNRRFPTPEAQVMGDAKVRSINIAGGPCKSYRLPLHCVHLVDDVVRWWCVGEQTAIHELLGLVGYLGKKRGVGLGKIECWSVDGYEPWGADFPVMRDGQPLRPLPLDWPGLVNPQLAMSTLTYPYWVHADERLLAVPA